YDLIVDFRRLLDENRTATMTLVDQKIIDVRGDLMRAIKERSSKPPGPLGPVSESSGMSPGAHLARDNKFLDWVQSERRSHFAVSVPFEVKAASPILGAGLTQATNTIAGP